MEQKGIKNKASEITILNGKSLCSETIWKNWTRPLSLVTSGLGNPRPVSSVDLISLIYSLNIHYQNVLYLYLIYIIHICFKSVNLEFLTLVYLPCSRDFYGLWPSDPFLSFFVIIHNKTRFVCLQYNLFSISVHHKKPKPQEIHWSRDTRG